MILDNIAVLASEHKLPIFVALAWKTPDCDTVYCRSRKVKSRPADTQQLYACQRTGESIERDKRTLFKAPGDSEMNPIVAPLQKKCDKIQDDQGDSAA